MMAQDLTIDRISVYAVGPKTERYTWASDMSEQYMTNNIVRIHTRGGLEGIGGAASYTEHAFDRAVAETMRPMLPPLLGASPLDREALWDRLLTRNIPLAPQAQSAIDVALWDLAAKSAGLPLHRMLGSARDRIPAYASTPLLPDAQAYVEFVGDLKRQGFTAVKFHAWCEIDRDLEMCRAVHERFRGSGMQLMLDVEQRYSRVDALRAARELEAMGFRWFEAPLPDIDLEGYRDLRRRVGIPILAAGNWVLDARLIELGHRAWAAGARCGWTRPSPAASRRPQDHGPRGGARARHRAPVLGLHADPSGEPAPHARPPELQPTSSSRCPTRPSSTACGT